MAKKRTEERPETRAPLTAPHKEYLLAHLLRLPELFSVAREQLRPEHFAGEDRPYAVLWRAALKLADGGDGRLPDEGAQRRIELAIYELLAEDQTALSEEQERGVLGDGGAPGLLEWAYAIPAAELDEKGGTALFKAFLHERTVVAPFRAYMTALGERNPDDFAAILDTYRERAGVVDGLTDTRPYPAFPGGVYVPTPVGIFPTTISFLDEYMEGGHAPREVYFLLGPSGVGKSLLGLQIAYDGALYQHYCAALDPEYELGHWYYFTYEQGVCPEVWHRVWAHAAQVHIDTFRKGTPLSTGDSLKPYERIRYEKELRQGLAVPGEVERFAAAEQRFQPMKFWLYDMSGTNPDDPHAGQGGIGELERLLARERRQGRRIAGFVIDYALLLVDRNLSAKGLEDPKHLYRELHRFGDTCRRRLAGQFECPGWLLHQLSGESNKRAPTAKQHHADSALCRSLGDNSSFAFNLGTKDQETSTCRISCTKTRRAAGDDKERIILIDGAFSTMVAADGRYTLDYRGKRIVPTALAEQVARAGTEAARPAAPDPAAAAGLFRKGVEFDS